jgi:broad specificity phosphatase PhoE
MSESTARTPAYARRLYLMRHGDVSYFDEQGRPFPPNNVTLTPRGEEQAQAAARALAGVEFDRVISSDLPRTIATATAVTAGRSVAHERRPDLREIQPGRLSEIPRQGLAAHFLKAFDKAISPATRFLNGETFGSLMERTAKFWSELAGDTRWNSVLVVAHGGVNRALIAHALGMDLKFFGCLEQDPGCINILDVDAAGRALIRMLNFSASDPSKEDHRFTTMEDLYENLLRGLRASRSS